jgi:threonine synthase
LAPVARRKTGDRSAAKTRADELLLTNGPQPVGGSLARSQRSLGDSGVEYPLWPPLTEGCPATSTPEVQYPLEVSYDYAVLDAGLFDGPPLPGLERWSPLLPPLADGLSMGEGGTPLVPAPGLARWAGFDGELFVKDESRNPTWSHKDRLNLCAVSAAVGAEAEGVVVSSSGNHGASAAAYAARAGLPCVVLVTDDAPPEMQGFVLAYGAAAVAVPAEERWPLMRRVVEEWGYHPLSNLTPTHTGHPFGPEGYKTIAYEVFLQLGRRVPAAVFVPTGYAELLFGVWKGFRELRELGVVGEVPRMVACEPAARAPLSRALATGRPTARVDGRPTAARSIAVTVSGYRGVVAVRESAGYALALEDRGILESREALSREGIWQELSGAAGVAGLRESLSRGMDPGGPVVCLACSGGLKDPPTERTVPHLEPGSGWTGLRRRLEDHYGLAL